MFNPRDPKSDDSSDTEHSVVEDGPQVPEATPPEMPEADFEQPTAPDPTLPDLESRADDVNPEFRAAFWKLVFIYDLAVFAVIAGALVVYYDENLFFGGQLLFAGVVGLAYALTLTWKWKRKLASDEFTVVTESDDEAPSTGDDSTAQPQEGTADGGDPTEDG